jgi:hypothetical protein
MAEGMIYFTVEKNNIQFREEAQPNEAASQKNGRACYDNVLLVEIWVPADRTTRHTLEVERVSHDGTKRENPLAYKRFKKEIEQHKSATEKTATTGMPIEKWPLVRPAQVAMMKSIGIYNVEGLAAVNGEAVRNLGPGGMALVQQAKDWLKTAGDSAAAMQAEARARALEADVAALREQLQAMSNSIETLPQADQEKVKTELGKRGPGRPRKTETAAAA